MRKVRVLLLSRYSRLGASSRIRSYQYLPYLEAHGFQVTVNTLFDDRYLKQLYANGRKLWGTVLRGYWGRLHCLLSARRYDLIWIEKEVFPWLPAWAETWLFRIGVPYVVDYDDAIFHKYDAHQNKLVRMLLGRKIDIVMRRAALVIVGNNYLAERARQAGARRVEILPSAVDLKRYSLRPQQRGKTVFTIGWIGTPLTAKYLRLVHSALVKVCRGHKARLLLVGSGPLHLAGVPVEIRSWSEETEVADIQNFDVGIMPLLDTPWERGKCGYKLIQCMACGKPVVASPVGINKEIVEDGINGFLASSETEWIEALNILRDNQELRQRMGEAARKKVEVQYSIQVTAPRLSELLRSVCKT